MKFTVISTITGTFFAVVMMLPSPGFIYMLIERKAAKWKFALMGLAIVVVHLGVLLGFTAMLQDTMGDEPSIGFGGFVLTYLGTMSVIALWMVGFMFLPARVRGFIASHAKTLPPQIGYKKASLGFDNPSTHFHGVAGYGYNSSAQAIRHTPGFHAYSSLEDALTHKQEGNVILEVLLSGNIKEMAKGYIATEQRVLQVAPYRCAFCQDHPTHYSTLDDKLQFICGAHAASAIFWAEAPGAPGKLPYNAHPLAELPEEFPWMTEEKIVVAQLSGPSKLQPTPAPTA